MKGKRRTASPALALLALLAIGGATLFGDRVPILNEVAGYLSELVGGGPQVSGLLGPAEVVRVSDGDTVRVLLEGTEGRARSRRICSRGATSMSSPARKSVAATGGCWRTSTCSSPAASGRSAGKTLPRSIWNSPALAGRIR